MCVFSGRQKIHIFTTKYAIFAKSDIFANQDAEIYYRTRLEFNILFFLARPRPRNKRFYSTKINFSDSNKKSRVDLGLEQPEMARNRKIEFPIFLENISRKAAIRRLQSNNFDRIKLKSSADIENFIFLSWPDSGRSPAGRFQENCTPRKTLQLSTKMRNISVSAARKTSNYATSLVFCKLFRFSTFVSKLLCGELANSAIILG